MSFFSRGVESGDGIGTNTGVFRIEPDGSLKNVIEKDGTAPEATNMEKAAEYAGAKTEGVVERSGEPAKDPLTTAEHFAAGHQMEFPAPSKEDIEADLARAREDLQ